MGGSYSLMVGGGLVVTGGVSSVGGGLEVTLWHTWARCVDDRWAQARGERVCGAPPGGPTSLI
jgi:hypothetical protein